MIYDYNTEVKNDIIDALDSFPQMKGESREEYAQRLNDELWTYDPVTGNGSGSYTFNSFKAWENLFGNLDLLGEACEEFGSSADILKEGPEALDVTIRCYLLGQCIEAALDEAGIEDSDEDEAK